MITTQHIFNIIKDSDNYFIWNKYEQALDELDRLDSDEKYSFDYKCSAFYKIFTPSTSDTNEITTFTIKKKIDKEDDENGDIIKSLIINGKKITKVEFITQQYPNNYEEIIYSEKFDNETNIKIDFPIFYTQMFYTTIKINITAESISEFKSINLALGFEERKYVLYNRIETNNYQNGMMLKKDIFTQKFS